MCRAGWVVRAGLCPAGWVLLSCLAASSAVAAEGGKTEYLTGSARKALLRHLESVSRSYDPEAKMIVLERAPKADHTKLHGRRAHPTRGSLRYAATLLEANDAKHRARACEIIRKVLSLQDTNPNSLTYGVWPWYAEEPPGEMFMVDYNWAAFLGRRLLYIVIHHDDQLPAELKTGVREAIRHACESIRRRPLHMGYTNIAAMSSYVALVAGERLGDPKQLAHGRYLFDKWYDYTMRLGSFTEFNSPTYTRVALGMVSRMMADVLDPDRRAKAEKLNAMLWEHLARRFHPPTRQWAGPCSRAYDDLRGAGFPREIQRALDNAVTFVPPESLGPDVGDWRHPFRAPRELAHYFKPLTAPREAVEVFFKAGDKIPNGLGNRSSRVAHTTLVGTTYLHPRFALGTVNLLDFWEQHRNLMAHWGTHDAPAYMTMRCMNRDYGFCSALFAGAQHKGDVLVAVPFMTDFGDRYIDLDRLPRQTLKTTSLRIEFALGGHLDEARIPARFDLDQPLVIEDRGTRIWLRYLGGTFDGQKPRAAIEKRKGEVILVVHLYEGDRKAFHLPTLGEAVCLFAIRFSDAAAGGEPPAPKASRDGTKYRAEFGGLRLEVPSVPLPLAEVQKQCKTTVNGAAPWQRAKSLLPGG